MDAQLSASAEFEDRRNERICQAARQYRDNLCNKKVLFVYGRPSSPQTVETEFKAGNFAHLVGVTPRDADTKASEIYYLACTNALKPSDCNFQRGMDYTDMKLEVINRVFNIDLNGRMIGDFQDGRFVNLKTDKVVGRQNAVLGLVDVGDMFVPNTVINADIREVARTTEQILATFKKDTDDQAPYSEFRYLAKSLTDPQIDTLRESLKNQGVLDKASHTCAIAVDKKPLTNSNGTNATPSADAKAVSRAAQTKRTSAAPHQGRAL